MRLREIGIQPDFLVCRNSSRAAQGRPEKLALFCNVLAADVIDAADAESIYTVPLDSSARAWANVVLRKLGIRGRSPDLSRWESLVERIRTPEGELDIAVVRQVRGAHGGLQVHLGGAVPRGFRCPAQGAHPLGGQREGECRECGTALRGGRRHPDPRRASATAASRARSRRSVTRART
jgi:hypothetical protein